MGYFSVVDAIALNCLRIKLYTNDNTDKKRVETLGEKSDYYPRRCCSLSAPGGIRTHNLDLSVDQL